MTKVVQVHYITDLYIHEWEPTDPSMEPCCKRIQANATMKAFLTAHGRQLDSSLPDGNCLFCSLCKQMTGDPTKHAELRELLINFISQNSHIFGRG